MVGDVTGVITTDLVINEDEDEEAIKECDVMLEVETPLEKEFPAVSFKQTQQKLTELKSSVGKMIEKVIGRSSNLLQFDYHHMAFKETKNETSRKICKNLIKILETNVKAEFELCKTFQQTWEKEFYLRNKKVPLHDDILADDDCTKNFNKIVVCKRLFKLWGIKY